MKKFRIYSSVILAVIVLLSLFFLSFNKAPKERYFFIGFVCSDGTSGGNWITTTDGTFIGYKKAVKDIKSYNKLSGEVSITSFYEFKNNMDYKQSQSGYR